MISSHSDQSEVAKNNISHSEYSQAINLPTFISGINSENHNISINKSRLSLLRKFDNGDSNFQEKVNEIWNTTIVKLSTRARNALLAFSIDDPYKLLTVSIQIICDFDNVGIKTANEIISLKDSLEKVNESIETEQVCIATTCRTLPDYSILNLTLTDLFISKKERLLSETNYHILTLSDVWNLEKSDWDLLNRMNLFFEDDNLEILDSLSLNWLIKNNIPSHIFNLLISPYFVSQCQSLLKNGNNYKPNLYFKDMTFYNSLLTLPLALLHPTNSIIHKLKELDIKSVCDYSFLSEREILQKYDVNSKSISIISLLWNADTLVEELYNIYEDDICLTTQSFLGLFAELIRNVSDNVRTLKIMEGRFELSLENGYTLEDLGSSLNITRERVRQIEKKCTTKIKEKGILNNIDLLRIAVSYYLETNSNIVKLANLDTFLTSTFIWNSQTPNHSLGLFLEEFFSYEYNGEYDIIYIKDHPCVTCKDLPNWIEARFQNNKNEVTINDLVLEIVTNNVKCFNCCSELSPVCLEFIIDNLSGIYIDGDILYSSDTWGAKRGSYVQLTEEMLLNQKRPMHFSEVYKEMKILNPNDGFTERAVQGWLNRSNRILLWNRGVFFHIDNIEIPISLLDKIENWVIKALDNIPFLMINAVYKHFEKECNEKGLISEYSLYTCLRLRNSNNLHFPRFPQIFLLNSFISRIPSFEVIEQYIESAGGEINFSDVREYALLELGLKTFQFTMAWSRCSEIIKASKNTVIHKANLHIKMDRFPEILECIKQFVSENGNVSVTKIFELKLVTCISCGVNEPELLYSLLQECSNNEFYFPRYPQITVNRGNLNISNSITEEIINYIREKKTFSTYDELEQRFIFDCGYKEITVFSVRTNKMLFKYSPSSLIHYETIGWTSQKQNVIEQLAYKRHLLNLAQGKFTTKVSELIDDILPQLENGTTWTTTLLSEILRRCSILLFIGNAHSAFMLRDNLEKIKSLEDLIVYILKTNFSGASTIVEMETFLKEREVIIKYLAPSMIKDCNEIKFINSNIILKGLVTNA